ncbi:hypothetical protein K402DRAFT_416735 [Aulographum hederae CBS 113979]|uniref:Uncharacterized protein n=1 Tax=Aulographum hederae CBS 113979 TaxID=1176131 RepID=A0A6G1HDW0_9PEZI|nr:hypothetical protein K402DRAFT_416735 [Aulographum hederae CBS 113979]
MDYLQQHADFSPIPPAGTSVINNYSIPNKLIPVPLVCSHLFNTRICNSGCWQIHAPPYGGFVCDNDNCKGHYCGLGYPCIGIEPTFLPTEQHDGNFSQTVFRLIPDDIPFPADSREGFSADTVGADGLKATPGRYDPRWEHNSAMAGGLGRPARSLKAAIGTPIAADEQPWMCRDGNKARVVSFKRFGNYYPSDYQRYVYAAPPPAPLGSHVEYVQDYGWILMTAEEQGQQMANEVLVHKVDALNNDRQRLMSDIDQSWIRQERQEDEAEVLREGVIAAKKWANHLEKRVERLENEPQRNPQESQGPPGPPADSTLKTQLSRLVTESSKPNSKNTPGRNHPPPKVVLDLLRYAVQKSKGDKISRRTLEEIIERHISKLEALKAKRNMEDCSPASQPEPAKERPARPESPLQVLVDTRTGKIALAPGQGHRGEAPKRKEDIYIPTNLNSSEERTSKKRPGQQASRGPSPRVENKGQIKATRQNKDGEARSDQAPQGEATEEPVQDKTAPRAQLTRENLRRLGGAGPARVHGESSSTSIHYTPDETPTGSVAGGKPETGELDARLRAMLLAEISAEQQNLKLEAQKMDEEEKALMEKLRQILEESDGSV